MTYGGAPFHSDPATQPEMSEAPRPPRGTSILTEALRYTWTDPDSQPDIDEAESKHKAAIKRADWQEKLERVLMEQYELSDRSELLLPTRVWDSFYQLHLGVGWSDDNEALECLCAEHERRVDEQERLREKHGFNDDDLRRLRLKSENRELRARAKSFRRGRLSPDV